MGKMKNKTTERTDQHTKNNNLLYKVMVFNVYKTAEILATAQSIPFTLLKW